MNSWPAVGGGGGGIADRTDVATDGRISDCHAGLDAAADGQLVDYLADADVEGWAVSGVVTLAVG